MFETIHTVVFEEKAGGGNPCPVTLNADELTTEEMQAMTKAFGVESVFLMKPTRPDCDIKARYFVPLHEMEMCIHATIGSATVLIEKGTYTKSPIIYETFYGPVCIDWEKRDGKIVNATVKTINPDGVTYTSGNEEVTVNGFDTIVLALGVKSYNPLENSLKDTVKELYVIGDANRPAPANKATEAALAVAGKI